MADAAGALGLPVRCPRLTVGPAARLHCLAAQPDRPAPLLRLDAVWGVLTLLPGAARDYSRSEFARDLSLLDQSGVCTTRAGRTVRWHASSGTRAPGC